MPPAIDGEARRADHIHPLVQRRLAGQPAHRQQQIGDQDQGRAGPAGDFDRKFDPAQLARFLSTYWRMPPER